MFPRGTYFFCQEFCASETSKVICLTFSHDGSQLGAGLSDNSVQVWDIATGKTKALFKGTAADDQKTAKSWDQENSKL